MLSLQLRSIERGERRLLGAVAATLPFVLVRVVYAAIGTYHSSDPNFHWFMASPHYYAYLIGMSVVMEMCAVVIIEAVRLTLQRLPGVVQKPDVPIGSPLADFPRQHKSSGTPELRDASSNV